MDPQTVPENVTDPRRAQDTKSVKEGDGHADHEANDSSTYPIQESTSTFLKLAFELKKPIDNKTRKTWEAKFRVPESDVTRCPKLAVIIKEVVEKDAIDEDRELSHFQNFFLDTIRPLVAAFEELSKEEPDADLTCAVIQQALLFLGNFSAHLSYVRCTKILKRLNQVIQRLAKTLISPRRLPTSSEKGLSKK